MTHRKYRKLCKAMLEAIRDDQQRTPGHLDPPDDDTLSEWFNSLDAQSKHYLAGIVFVNMLDFNVPEKFFRDGKQLEHMEMPANGKVH